MLHQHQIDYLQKELVTFANSDAAFVALRAEALAEAQAKTTVSNNTVGPAMEQWLIAHPNATPLPRRLTAVSFVTPAKFFAKPKFMSDLKCKQRRVGLVKVPLEQAANFPSGLPGIPNILQKEDLDHIFTIMGE